MHYHKYELLPYNLHVIQTDKFKTIHVKINFKRETIKEELTMRHLLADVLTRTTKQYQTEREVMIACEDLYGPYYDGSVSLSGNYSIISFDYSFLNETYTEPGMNAKSFRFLMELLTNPNAEDGRFDPEGFQMSKNSIESHLLGIKDEASKYSTIRMFEHMEANSPLSYRSDGYLEDLDDINEETLYQYYQGVMKSDLIDIFIIGNVDDDEMKQLFSTYFSIKTFKKTTKTHMLEHKKFRLRAKSIKEQEPFTQSQLTIGYKLEALTDFERDYVSNIYSVVLGGDVDSRLMKGLREGHSLCYSIYSQIYKVYHVMVIKAGIDANNAKKAISLIKKEIQKINKGDINLEEIEKAKITYLGGCKKVMDSPSSILNVYVAKEYLNSDSIEERMKKIEAVRKEDVIKFSQKIHLDTIYLLEGSLEDEED